MRLFTKENMMKLTTEERRDLMHLQMSGHRGNGSDYLPDDCSYCEACGYPTLGWGWCNYCYKRFEELVAKLRTQMQIEMIWKGKFRYFNLGW